MGIYSPALKKQLARGVAFLGGGLGLALVLSVWYGQLNLDQVFRGAMPLRLALRLSSDILGFMLLLALAHGVALFVALRRNFPRLGAGLIWLAVSGLLAYAIYLARFSLGPLLIPSTTLIALAGLATIWPEQK